MTSYCLLILNKDNKIQIKNTFKDTGEIIHETNELPTDIKFPVKLKIDKNRRSLIESNHTSTHLLHQALRNILGNHVEQRGSMISDKMFRFDFSHQNKISDLELMNISNFVNEKIISLWKTFLVSFTLCNFLYHL